MGVIGDILGGFGAHTNSVLPTPVYEAPALSSLSECRVFIKRDDLTGFGFGGNKVRKMDFLIADAIRSGCNTLLATGAVQSNFCRVVAAFGAYYRMKVYLVLGGKKPALATGNFLLDQLLGAECHHVESEDWEDWVGYATELACKLEHNGYHVYSMPPGGSTAIGTLGYLSAMSEITSDEKRMGLNFDIIVHATSSGGTQAGLVAGQAILNRTGQILGISTARESNDQSRKVKELAAVSLGFLGINAEMPEVMVDDRFLGSGYGKVTEECREAVVFFARECGIFLDYVYTGKAAAGLLHYLRTGSFRPGSNILFIHTGGNPELFA